MVQCIHRVRAFRDGFEAVAKLSVFEFAKGVAAEACAVRHLFGGKTKRPRSLAVRSERALNWRPGKDVGHMPPEDHAAVIRSHIEAFNAGDLSRCATFVTEDFELRDIPPARHSTAHKGS